MAFFMATHRVTPLSALLLLLLLLSATVWSQQSSLQFTPFSPFPPRFLCLFALLEKKLNVAGKPRYVLHELVHNFLICVKYHELICEVSRLPRYIGSIFYSVILYFFILAYTPLSCFFSSYYPPSSYPHSSSSSTCWYSSLLSFIFTSYYSPSSYPHSSSFFYPLSSSLLSLLVLIFYNNLSSPPVTLYLSIPKHHLFLLFLSSTSMPPNHEQHDKSHFLLHDTTYINKLALYPKVILILVIYFISQKLYQRARGENRGA